MLLYVICGTQHVGDLICMCMYVCVCVVESADARVQKYISLGRSPSLTQRSKMGCYLNTNLDNLHKEKYLRKSLNFTHRGMTLTCLEVGMVQWSGTDSLTV